MKKFIALYHAPAEALKQDENITPEEHQAEMQLWYNWKAKNEEAVLDFGAPLVNGNAIDKKLSSAPSFREVCGYSVFQGESQDELRARFTDHPHLKWHPEATIELHEVMDI